MGQVNGVDRFVLKTSEKQKDYKVYYVGESKDAVDLTAGNVTEIVFGNGGTAIGENDLYKLVIRERSIKFRCTIRTKRNVLPMR